MTKNTKIVAKGGIAALAAGALALGGVAPAYAGDDRDGLSIGDIIAGAVIIGGIAAVAKTGSRDRGYDYRDGSYYGRDGYQGYDRYGYRGNPRSAVERCVNAARNEAQRYGYRHAQVTDIRDVDDTRYGWRVKGRIAVQDNRGHAWGNKRYDSRYDRYDNRYDDRYRGDRYRSARDEGTFTCYIERGRIADVNIGGIRDRYR